MSGLVQTNQIVNLPLAVQTLSVNDSGKIIITGQTAGGGFLYTLPLPAAGLHYRFINGAALALNGSLNITTNAGNAIIFGGVTMGPTGGVALIPVNGSTFIGFNSAASLRGDYIDLISDGTNWYCDAHSRVALSAGGSPGINVA